MAQQEEIIKDTQTDPLPKLENIYFLMIQVIGAKDLERADFNGSSDPFCKVIANKQSWSTKYIKKNLNPEWNEETSFVFFNAVQEIRFEVYDWDNGSKHDLIGTATLDTKSFYEPQSPGFKDSIKLENCKNGSIEICVTGRLVKPLELEDRCKALEAESKKQDDEINRKNNECQSLMQKNAEYAQTKGDLLKNQKKYNDELTELTETIKTQKKYNADKQVQCDQLRKNKQVYQKKINDKENDIKKKRDEYKQESKKLAKADDEYKNLQQEVTAKRENYDNGSYKDEYKQNYAKSSNTSNLGKKEPLLT